MTRREAQRIARMREDDAEHVATMPERKRKERKPERPVRQHWMRWYSLMEAPDGDR